ncbi:cytochrome P450 [Massariosphaeria phaeospora]|uniref:Cytochrome P450 n=1 Tax=Massariosphaeria phaeospora TaxID=100035 RepID=A0A7C8IBT8_9PLEO|nr:cytochrome P450 [Massariosphaeria phaeospora]
MVYGPEVAVQVSTKYNLPKTEQIGKSILPIIGGPSLISMNGDEWKTWRSLFKPGFSAASMSENVPHIVRYVQIFCDKLTERAGKGLFKLDDLTTRLTMDVIIKLTLDTDLDYQRSENPLSNALGWIARWHSFWDPRILMHPFRPFIQRYFSKAMDDFIRKELDQRFLELKASKSVSSGRTKSVIALALEAYMAENASKDLARMTKLDDHFARYATYQIRLFLFAGNDTTSSSIIYAYHLLSQHPEILDELRKEHDSVFGTDTSKVADMLKEKPALLNQCRYTLAVIKETLRLCAPASTMRAPRSGVVVTDRHNNAYPMDHVGATIVHPTAHLNPRVWPRPTEFLPECFLVDSDHELYPNPGAYRPFEQGPRACIGQTLVYNEMRTVLALTGRSFEISPAYDEWDREQERSEGWMKKLGKRVGLVREMPRTVHGDRAYQTEKAGTHPADGYPCRVELVHSD